MPFLDVSLVYLERPRRFLFGGGSGREAILNTCAPLFATSSSTLVPSPCDARLNNLLALLLDSRSQNTQRTNVGKTRSPTGSPTPRNKRSSAIHGMKEQSRAIRDANVRFMLKTNNRNASEKYPFFSDSLLRLAIFYSLHHLSFL